MSSKPDKKFFGNLNLDNIGHIYNNVPSKKDNYNGTKQIKVEAAMWPDGNIALYVWDGQKEVKIGRLQVSNFSAPKLSKDDYETNDQIPF